MENKIKRMKELINILNEASISYYQKSISIMSDYEYDKLYDELVELEKDTNTVLSNSPTINVEPAISNSLKKVEHPSPMLSLSKTKSVDELSTFLGNKEGLISWKLDGLTIVLTYEDGILTSGVTRGNGIIGEDVTENVKMLENVPLTIPFKGKLILRGEAIIKYSDFNNIRKINLDSDKEYKNPRNLCSGSIRQLDPNITKNRHVNLVVFALIEAENKTFKYKEEEFEFLKSLGLEVVEYFKVDKDSIYKSVEEFKKRVVNYDIPTDGLVLSYNDIDYGNSLGMTAKFPRHSIAFKWKDENATTTLIDVDWLVSRTGLINPVAVFTPVEIEGSTVSRASVHNVSILKELKLGINDQINVYKANMIIPQISENLTKSDNVIIPSKCPTCSGDTKIISNNNVKYLYCTNEFCPGKLMKRLSLFVSRNAMNIVGLSDSILSTLLDEGIITNYKDLYHLDNHKEEIINMEGFGLKSYENLILSIEESRNVKLANFIYALGIPEIGFSRAKLICSSFNNDFDKLCNLSFEELSNIDGIGEIVAKSYIDAFNNKDFLEELNELKDEIHLHKSSNNELLTLKDLSFVITGVLNNFDNRDALVEYIEDHGGKVNATVSSNTSYLINNDINSTSSKNKKAKELDIPIITEEELIKMSE